MLFHEHRGTLKRPKTRVQKYLKAGVIQKYVLNCHTPPSTPILTLFFLITPKPLLFERTAGLPGPKNLKRPNGNPDEQAFQVILMKMCILKSSSSSKRTFLFSKSLIEEF